MTSVIQLATEVPPPKVFRWSFSQWESYQQCPAKWKYQSVLRLPRAPSGPAAARGTHLHDRVEGFIRGENTAADLLAPLDPGALGFVPAPIHPKYIPILEEFRDHSNGARYTEFKVAFDHEWYIVPNNLPTASCIMVLDAVRVGGPWEGVDRGVDEGVVRIGEWKSGKPKDTHSDQRKMYAVAGLKMWMAKTVEVTTYYLEDTAPPARLVVHESAWDKLVGMWGERRNLMMRDEICAPRPGFYCRWCDYSVSKAGPCKF